MKKFTIAFILILSATIIKAQISGTVFRDFNGNGQQDNSAAAGFNAANIESGIAGVTIRAFNSSDVLLASQTTNANGLFNFPVGSGANQIPNGTAVRLEYILPQNCIVNSSNDFTGQGGSVYGSNVQFKTQSSSGVTANFSISNPEQFRGSINNPKVFIPRHNNGNPVAVPAGNSATEIAMYSFNYTASGQSTTGNNARTSLATAAQIGPCWGVAYNKYNDRIYTSAIVKRHSGLGPGGPVGSPNPVNAPGAVYIVNPNVVNSGSFFFSMDALGASYHTHDHTPGALLNVRDNVTRGLNKDIEIPSTDAAAFDQTGKTGIGDLELSEDGRYLWLTNLYDRKLYRIDLTNPAAPVAPTAITAPSLITSWNLPALTCNSTLRPWGLKWYRGKIYVGVVCTGETDANANNPANVNTNYNGTTVTSGSFNTGNAYILEFNPAGAGTWVTTLTIPLSYPRGNAADENFEITRWYNWTNNFNVIEAYPFSNSAWALIHPQPILSNIEFDVDGTMMIGFIDRVGIQSGFNQHDLNGNNFYYGEVGGDLLRAYNNGCTYQLETNGKEGASSPKAATTGINTGQGPGSGSYGAGGTNYGEFYWDERYFWPSGPYWAHVETSLGNLAFLPGSNEIMEGVMDPFDIYSNGTANFNNTTGAANSRYEVVSIAEPGTFRKASSLGDIELILPLAPIEIGNRVWNDANNNGIQDAGENGIAGVMVELYDGPGISLLATATTDGAGNFYFNTSNVSGGIIPNTNYILRIISSQFNNIGSGPLAGLSVAQYAAAGNGAPGLSDNDATKVSGKAQISFTTGGYGQNNHNLDFGFSVSTLPATLISFTAQLINDNQATLKWTTASENNLDHFVVERSNDGVNFIQAATVLASGRSGGVTNYNLPDNINVSGPAIIYYRLRSVDRDGKNYLSSIRILRLGKNRGNNISIITYPNPVKNELRVTIPSSWQNQNITYEILFANGQLAKKQNITTSNQTETISLANLAPGIYIVRVIFEGQTAEQKIVKQ